MPMKVQTTFSELSLYIKKMIVIHYSFKNITLEEYSVLSTS